MDKNLRREIILDNYNHPFNKDKKLDEPYTKANTNNESCIDNLNLYFKFDNDILKDISFDGEACAISTSATSIISRLILNKTKDEIKAIIKNYEAMINEENYDKDNLKELIVYDEIYLQPNRKNCALLPIKAIEKALKE